jgi:cysteinyl-tRNA synthetase
MPLSIYNTLSRSKEIFKPITEGQVRMYVCGMTVYDFCHLGHARVMIVFDMVTRWLRASGYVVSYVRNITDIDDKIIKRALENKEPIAALTQRFIDAMHADAKTLGLLPPDHEPRATQYIAQMQGMIGRLIEQEMAYQADDGDVNYAVRQFPSYGKLSGKSIDELKTSFSGNPPKQMSRVIHAGHLLGAKVDPVGILSALPCRASFWESILIFMGEGPICSFRITRMRLPKAKVLCMEQSPLPIPS